MTRRGEKMLDFLIAAVGFIVVVPAGFLAFVWLFGSMIEGAARYDQQHDACLKQATNGYEIRACH
jgi:hypothetical protein